MNFDNLIRTYNIEPKQIWECLGISKATYYSKYANCDNLLDKPLSTIIQIHNFTKIPYHILITSNDTELINTLKAYKIDKVSNHNVINNLLTIIDKQQNVIKELSLQCK